jgi:diguanylate cyclase (GGDEF)-like protein
MSARDIRNEEAAAGLPPEELELRGFNRTLAEIEWLLLVLILAYLAITGISGNFIIILVAYATFVLGFRYSNLLTLEARWKLSIETWVMIGLTALVVWQSGKADSPLVNLYLLPIIFSALTLGKFTTLMQVLLICALYLHAAQATFGFAILSLETFGRLLLQFAPFVLVAYLTSLLAADMKLGRDLAQHLSETDELTGLPNMRAFSVAIASEKSKADRDGTAFSVLMIDADDLKPVNDDYGHEVGNQLIQHLVDIIRKSLRTSDVIARYGGDEFVVLLPGTPHERSMEVAERIRYAIEHTVFYCTDKDRINVTASIGCASYPDTAKDTDELLARADEAMYDSKRAGRNQVSAFEHRAAS